MEHIDAKKAAGSSMKRGAAPLLSEGWKDSGITSLLNASLDMQSRLLQSSGQEQDRHTA